MNEKHLGSTLDDFLAEEGLFSEAEAVAAKRVLAFQIANSWKNTSVPRQRWRAG